MKYRVIVNKVHFYTTTSAIKRGIGDMISINKAVLDAHDSLQDMRKGNSLKPIGLCGNWRGHDVQIDLV